MVHHFLVPPDPCRCPQARVQQLGQQGIVYLHLELPESVSCIGHAIVFVHQSAV